MLRRIRHNIALSVLLLLVAFTSVMWALCISVSAVPERPENVYSIRNSEELLWFSQRGGVFTVSEARLMNDIVINGETLTFDNGSFLLDLNGHTLKSVSDKEQFISVSEDASLTVKNSNSQDSSCSVEAPITVIENRGELIIDSAKIMLYNSSSDKSVSAIINRNALTVLGSSEIESSTPGTSYAVDNKGSFTMVGGSLKSNILAIDSSGPVPSTRGAPVSLYSTSDNVKLSVCQIGGMKFNVDKDKNGVADSIRVMDIVSEGLAIYQIASYSWYADATLLENGLLSGSFNVLESPLRLSEKSADVTVEYLLLEDVTFSLLGVGEGEISYFWSYNGSTDRSVTISRNDVQLGENVYTCEIYNPCCKIYSDFKITATKTDISNVNLSYEPKVIYDGKSHKPIPKLTYGENTLMEGRDYTVKYYRDSRETEDFVSCGNITVKFSGIGVLNGERTVDFAITQRPLNVIIHDKWIDSISDNQYSVYGELAFGDTIFASYSEWEHEIGFSAFTVLNRNGEDVTDNYRVEVTNGKLHIPTENYSYNSAIHYIGCRYGCPDAKLHEEAHTRDASGMCTVCGYSKDTDAPSDNGANNGSGMNGADNFGKGEDGENLGFIIFIIVISALVSLLVPVGIVVFIKIKNK